jgi:hypothetical protein
MRASMLILLCLAGIVGACPGCKHLEHEMEYGSMTGSIPEDSLLYSSPDTAKHK